ncbi:hypothetical protein M427DRAFT_61872 [Gonapodya prolifera JEL478]|uniref:Ankyrin n=1 Tax=Gonapodya prolifera (strain JEL478) TaxID=1344416 RepID=A0A139A1K9_GONPJ|nr:hypothetical protein M427DRAFT_61872 [Gonapodya prolifera JEL478]|eukprot:KXS10667.1 hypothetical protein M427DRAFT_61872 [Gonapodya prolifera JEL478]
MSSRLEDLPSDVLLYLGRFLPGRLGLPLSKHILSILGTPRSIAERALWRYGAPLCLAVEARRKDDAALEVVRSLLGIESVKRTINTTSIDTTSDEPTCIGTALEAAATAGNAKTVSLLLDHGALATDKHELCDHETCIFVERFEESLNGMPSRALIAAVEERRPGVVRLLMDAGADPTLGDGEALKEALMYGGDIEILRIILERIKDPNFVDNIPPYGTSAMSIAVEYGNVAGARFLEDWLALHMINFTMDAFLAQALRRGTL